jgi:hypothetical protein
VLAALSVAERALTILAKSLGSDRVNCSNPLPISGVQIETEFRAHRCSYALAFFAAIVLLLTFLSPASVALVFAFEQQSLPPHRVAKTALPCPRVDTMFSSRVMRFF